MTHVVELPESLTVRSIADFATRLAEIMDSDAAVELDAGRLGEVDLSFVQLMLAARAHAAQRGGALRLASPAGPAIAALLERAGFLTDPDPADLDFWFHGDLPQ
jgi:hypothetical protein